MDAATVTAAATIQRAENPMLDATAAEGRAGIAGTASSPIAKMNDCGAAWRTMAATGWWSSMAVTQAKTPADSQQTHMIRDRRTRGSAKPATEIATHQIDTA